MDSSDIGSDDLPPPPPPPDPLPSEWRFSTRKVLIEVAFLAVVMTVFRTLQRLIRPDAEGGALALLAIAVAMVFIYVIEVWEDFGVRQKAVIRTAILVPVILVSLALVG